MFPSLSSSPRGERRSAFFHLFTILSLFVVLLNPTAAEQMIQSSTLASCIDNSQFTVTQFNVLYTPNNTTLVYDFKGTSSIASNVTVILEIIAYGYTAFQ